MPAASKPASASPWAPFHAKNWTAHLEEFPDPNADGEEAEYDTPKLDARGKPVKDAQGRPVMEKKRGPKRLPITFRESGDPASLVDLVFGGETGADKNRAMATLVVSSVQNPPIGEDDYHALALGCKLALFTEIMNHVKKDAKVDFLDGADDSKKTPAEQKTDDGGPGARRRPSVSALPNVPSKP